MQKYFLTLFIFLSFITQTFTEPGTNPILSRLTPGDIFGVLALLFGIKAMFLSLNKYRKYTKLYSTALFMVLCFFLPVFFSLNLQSTTVECLILVFLIFLSILIFNTYKDDFLSKLIPLIMYTAITAAFLGVYDYASAILGLPRLFPARANGEILSGFRNAGQAGAYFLVIITILYPLRFSSLFRQLNTRNQKLLNISIIVSILFLALTGKIAAYIGLFFGLLGYAVLNRNVKTIFSLTISGVILFGLFTNLESIAPDVHKRITMKYQSRVDDNIEGNVNFEEGFISRNINAAIQSFEDRPLIGSGLGAFYGNYGRHEVHSTYFKMLGETGIIGVIGYLFFMGMFYKSFKIRKYGKINPYADYLRSMFPFILGCLVSWAYTYHLRKREFWILAAILLIVNYCAYTYKQLEKNLD